MEEELEVVKRFIKAYFMERNLEKIEKTLSEDVVSIGTSDFEYSNGRNATLEMCKQEIITLPEAFEIDYKVKNIIKSGKDAATIFVYFERIHTTALELDITLRITFAVVRINGEWKINFMHASQSNQNQNEGEFFNEIKEERNQLLDVLPGGSFIMKKEEGYNIFSCSKGIYELFNIKEEKHLTLEDFKEFVNDYDYSVLERGIYNLFENKGIVETSMKIKLHDGGVFWVNVIGFTVIIDSKEVFRIIVIKASDSFSMQNEILEVSESIIFAFDPKTKRLLYTNQMMRRLMEDKKVNDEIEKYIHVFNEDIHCIDLPKSIERYIESKNMYLRVTFNNISWNGHKAILCVGRDITDSKYEKLKYQSNEKMFQLLMEKSFFSIAFNVSKGSLISIDTKKEVLDYIKNLGEHNSVIEYFNTLFEQNKIETVDLEREDLLEKIYDLTKNNTDSINMELEFKVRGRFLKGNKILDCSLRKVRNPISKEIIIFINAIDITRKEDSLNALNLIAKTEYEFIIFYRKKLNQFKIIATKVDEFKKYEYERISLDKIAKLASYCFSNYTIQKRGQIYELEDYIKKYFTRDCDESKYDEGYALLVNGDDFMQKKISTIPFEEDKSLIVVSDNTSAYRKQLSDNQKLGGLLIEANAANDAKSIFLSAMSHDIRTPLNVIIGETTLAIEDTEATDPNYENLLLIKEQSNHLLNIINDILEMSKIESGNVEVETTCNNISVEIKRFDTLILPLVKSKRIKLFTHKNFNENIVAYFDAKLTRRVLYNIVNNAIKFTPRDGRIDISYNVKKINGKDYLEIENRDNGIGIAKENQSKIFNPFYRVGNSATGGKNGTGLGLSIVSRYVKAMDGNIEVESELGKGLL